MPMQVEIWHNPACGTSRNALALIRHVGIEPDIVEYLQATPDKARLREAIAAAGHARYRAEHTVAALGRQMATALRAVAAPPSSSL